LTNTAQSMVVASLALLVIATLMLAWILYLRIDRLIKRAEKFADLAKSDWPGAALRSYKGNEADTLLAAFTVLESTLSNAMDVISDSQMTLATAAAAQVSKSDQRQLGNFEQSLSTQGLMPLAHSISVTERVGCSSGDPFQIPDVNSRANLVEGQPTATGFRKMDMLGERQSAGIYDFVTKRRTGYGPPPQSGHSITEARATGLEIESAGGGWQPCPPGYNSLISTSSNRSFIKSELSQNEAAVFGLYGAAEKNVQLLQRVDSAQAALNHLNLILSKINAESHDSQLGAEAQACTTLDGDSGIHPDRLIKTKADGVKVTRSAIGKLSQVADKLSQLASRFSV